MLQILKSSLLKPTSPVKVGTRYNIRSIFREYQVAGAGDRFPLLKPLLERCLSLHAEDRLSASEAMRAVESLRADPCAYRPAGRGAGILADRWFQVDFGGGTFSCS